MGKKLLFLFVLIVLIGFFAFFRSRQTPHQKSSQTTSVKQNTPIFPSSVEIESLTIFVPYWSLTRDIKSENNYGRSVYFGITPTENGISKDEPGYNNLSTYNQFFQTGQRLLAVRITNTDLAHSILTNNKNQGKIISETIEIAKENNFSGIVLDLELFSLFDTKIPGQINDFVSEFSRALKRDDLYFAFAVYGDVFYRRRPYDVKSISQQVDELMIMAYDFSKSIGEPGPNFPLSGREKYGYDLKKMIEDYLTVAPKEKISVIFGMYGYDWTVDKQKRPVKPAQALTINQIKQKYLENCKKPGCKILPNKLSAETEVDSGDHIIWFEDLTSSKTKQDYLRSQGISKFAYWALGYF